MSFCDPIWLFLGGDDAGGLAAMLLRNPSNSKSTNILQDSHETTSSIAKFEGLSLIYNKINKNLISLF